MKKRVVDLDFDRLSELAAEAGAEAVRATLAAGVSVTGVLGNATGISTLYPDGSTEKLDPRTNPRPVNRRAIHRSRHKNRVA